MPNEGPRTPCHGSNKHYVSSWFVLLLQLPNYHDICLHTLLFPRHCAFIQFCIKIHLKRTEQKYLEISKSDLHPAVYILLEWMTRIQRFLLWCCMPQMTASPRHHCKIQSELEAITNPVEINDRVDSSWDFMTQILFLDEIYTIHLGKGWVCHFFGLSSTKGQSRDGLGYHSCLQM